MEHDFEKALRVAQGKLAEAIAERSALDKRILELRQVVASLSAVLEGEGLEHSDADSISTEEVRNIFQAKTNEVLSAADVAGELKKLGYHLEKYQSPLATIGTILNRLKDKGDIFSTTDKAGKRGFQAHPIYRLKPRMTKGGSGVIDKGTVAYLLQLAQGKEKK